MTMLENVLNRRGDTLPAPACPMCGAVAHNLSGTQLFPTSRTHIEVKQEQRAGVPYYDFAPAHLIWQCHNCGQNVGTYLYSATV